MPRLGFLSSRAIVAWIVLLGALFSGEGLADGDDAAQAGWRTRKLTDVLPDRVSLRIDHRIRYESLQDEFRASARGDREIVVLRTLVNGRVNLIPGLWLGAELEDSRAVVNGDTLLNTTIENPVELLRGYLEYSRDGVFGGKLLAQAGRITMDLGSRRFVARNRYRNTINGFSGIDLQWKNTEGTSLRAFWTLPVRRQPARFTQLREHKIQDDEEDFDLQFWGVYASRSFSGLGQGEVFLLGLHEQDEPSRRTRKRELLTPGFRLYRKPAAGQWDYTLETAFQVGRSRANAAAKRLDHFAHFHHAEVGYSWAMPWSPRLALEYDFASGDRDPADGDNNRFDTLFGARRFDFGPTGIYGPFARSNVNTPGIRVQVKPGRGVTSFLAVRTFWLADRSDGWTTSGLRDVRGKSGQYVGSQIEMRVRWQILPGNLKVEAGYAHLFDGEFMRNAPNSNRPGDLDYFYTQLAISL